MVVFDDSEEDERGNQLQENIEFEEMIKENKKSKQKSDMKSNPAVNKYGDDMTEFLWNGPEDSDEEIEEFKNYKTEWEK